MNHRPYERSHGGSQGDPLPASPEGARRGWFGRGAGVALAAALGGRYRRPASAGRGPDRSVAAHPQIWPRLTGNRRIAGGTRNAAADVLSRMAIFAWQAAVGCRRTSLHRIVFYKNDATEQRKPRTSGQAILARFVANCRAQLTIPSESSSIQQIPEVSALGMSGILCASPEPDSADNYCLNTNVRVTANTRISVFRLMRRRTTASLK
jgi:hypothetical protein